MNRVFVRFERGRDDIMGPTFGPFEWVQQTYTALRVPHGDQASDRHLAWWNSDLKDWVLDGGEGGAAGAHDGEMYSDFIVFSAEGPDANWPHTPRDCFAARFSSDDLESISVDEFERRLSEHLAKVR